MAVLIFILLMILALTGTTAPANAAKPSFSVGVAYQADAHEIPRDRAYKMISMVGDTAYIQRNWKQWRQGAKETDGDITLARENHLKVYLALDILSYDDLRGHIILPNNEQKALFADASVKKAYLELVRKVAAKHPDYLNFLVEASFYKDKNPADYQAFRQLLPEAIGIVRKLSPGTKTMVSISYGDHNHEHGLDSEDAEYFKNCVLDFENLTDLLAISTYPMFYLNPTNLPDDFIHTICSFSNKPLFLAETSWVSEDFDVSLPKKKKVKFHSNPEMQGIYVRRLLHSAALAKAGGDKVDCINFVALTDPGQVSSILIKIIEPKFSWFTSLGICYGDGKEKPAYKILQEFWTGGARSDRGTQVVSQEK